MVVLVHVDDVRLESLRLLGGHLRVGDEDDQVTGVDQVGGGAVDPQDPRPALARDGVGLQPGTVGDVDDGDQLAGEDVRGVEEIGVDGDRADVVEVCLGDRGAVDLAGHHGAQTSHRDAPIVRLMLSMSRVVPRRAAMRIRASVAGSGSVGSAPSAGSVTTR